MREEEEGRNTFRLVAQRLGGREIRKTGQSKKRKEKKTRDQGRAKAI